MRHRIAGRKLGRASGHRKAMYRSQVTDLLGYEKILMSLASLKVVNSILADDFQVDEVGTGLHGTLELLRIGTHGYARRHHPCLE